MNALDRADSLDERDEALEQALDFIQQSSKRWHNRLTFQNPRLAERYLEDELEIGVLLKEVGGGGKEWCALLNRRSLGRLDEDREGWQILCSLAGSAKECGDVEAERPVGGGGDRDEQAVYVNDIELIKKPDLFSVPTSVRLERIDRIDELLRGPWHLSAYCGLEFSGRWGALAPDGEGHLRNVGRVRHGGVGEVIEAGPDGVNGVTEDQGYGTGERGRLRPDLDHALPRLRIILGNEWIGIGPMEGDNRCFEVINVMFRSVELQPDAIETGHMDGTC
jgi:hypothetical protein